jgi:glycolate oxidase FAD binding subunit
MTLQLTTASEIQQAVREHTRVHTRGGGTKSSPPDGAAVFDLSGVAGVTDYSPAECVFTALAGTSLREITETLASHGQYLPFDPPFADDGATIGGTVASGVSGSGRYRYGGVRDFLIGVRVVDGEGRLIRSGGKVVKNAAGFLLHHGMVGSLGRFGILTEVTFKVFPQPEAQRTITVKCESVAAAFAAARAVERLRCDCAAIDFDDQGWLRVVLAGRAAAIDARATRLAHLLGSGRESRESGSGRESHESGSGREASCVKVVGLMNGWDTVRDHVTSARFMCAGSVAWLITDRLRQLTDALRQVQLAGLVIRGTGAGERIGHLPHNEFEDRVRHVLDPQNKFSATSDSRR